MQLNLNAQKELSHLWSLAQKEGLLPLFKSPPNPTPKSCRPVDKESALLQLGHEDPAQVSQAAYWLGVWQYEKALPILRALIHPERFIESEMAIFALGEMKDIESLPLLKACMKQGFYPSECLLALGKIGDLQILPTFLAALESPYTQESASEALVILFRQNPQIIDLKAELVPLLEPWLLTENSTKKSRFYILLALSRLKETKSFGFIRYSLGLSLPKKNLQ